MRSGPLLTPLHAASVSLGAVILGYALQIRNGFYDPVALAGALLAAVCVVAGAARLRSPRGSEPMVAGVLVAGLLANGLALTSAPIAMYLTEPDPAGHPVFLAGVGAAVALGILIAADPRRARRFWFPALLAAYALLGIWLIEASPRPRIDVLTVFRHALAALARLDSPYSITFPNIYPDESLYGAGLVVDGQVQFGFPYPPLSLLMALPADILRLDVRYAQLGSLLAAAAWMGACAPGRVPRLAAAALLFTPRTFFVLEQGWTESMVLCWGALTIYAARRSGGHPAFAARWRGLPALALGLFVAAKQHLVVALLLTGWLSRSPGAWRRLLAGSVATAAAVTTPFLLWDPDGFWRSVVVLQLREPFRLDSLSVLSWAARAGWTLPSALLLAAPLAAGAAGLTLSWRRLPRTPAGFALGLGTAFFLLFLFSKKAFCNYYFLVIGLLLCGVAAASGDFRSDDVDGSAPAALH